MQTRRLKPDENLIFHLITSQSSSVSTALRELVQNAYDAEATECFITLNQAGFRVKDDGKGFGSEKEVEEFFETFGTPHEEDRHQKFGRFRMGRCQIMAFAPTDWHSNTFGMQVDIKNRGLDYSLSTRQEPQPGCVIEGRWYEELSQDSITDLIYSLKRHFEYFYRMPVWLNGERISTAFEDLRITAESPEFYLIADAGCHALTVHNLGMYVQRLNSEYPRWDVYGQLISKEHLQLDISRTEWLTETCPLWKKAQDFLHETFPRVKRKDNFTKSDIRFILAAVKRNEIPFQEIVGLKIFHNPQGTHRYSIADLDERDYTFAWPGQHTVLADKIDQQGSVVVLSMEELCAVYSVNGYVALTAQFLRDINRLSLGTAETEYEQWGDRIAQRASFTRSNHIPFTTALTTYNEAYELIDASALTPTEQCALKALETANTREYFRLSGVSASYNRKAHRTLYPHARRKVCVGVSPHADGWTDGMNYIAINRELLSRLKKGVGEAEYLATVLLHEWCHTVDNPSTHNAEFYKLYHDLTCDPDAKAITSMAARINSSYAKYLKKQGLPVPEAVRRTLTGRAAQDERTQKAFVQLTNKFDALEAQHKALADYMSEALQQLFDPEKKTPEGLEVLEKIYKDISYPIDWVKLKTIPFRKPYYYNRFS